MESRAEVTTKFAREHTRAAKKDNGTILDQFVAVTGWSRDNACQRLTAAAKRLPGRGRQVAKRARKQRPPKYSYEAIKALQTVWAASGGQCGKYLAASMSLYYGFGSAQPSCRNGIRSEVPVHDPLVTRSEPRLDPGPLVRRQRVQILAPELLV